MRNNGERVASMRVGGVEIAIGTGGGDRRVPVALGCAAALAGALLAPGAVNAETVNGVVTIAEPVAGVRSIGLSADSVALSACFLGGVETTGLDFPNGSCQSPVNDRVLVTYHNTDGSPGHVHVNGGNATGDEGGTWTLGATPPGPDEYAPSVVFSGTFRLGATAACDEAWSNAADPCAAADGDSALHQLSVVGPESTTYSDSTWTVPYVFTAVA